MDTLATTATVGLDGSGGKERKREEGGGGGGECSIRLVARPRNILFRHQLLG